jgi:hypothetical protein
MQKQIQKKTMANIPAAKSSHSGFANPGFTVQSKSDKASPDIKTQLSRATRFGHNMSQMATMQTKTAEVGNQTIQRQEEKEEPEQMKSEQSPAIQRQEEQEEPEQMKSEQSPAIQRQAASPTPSGGNSIPGGVRAKMENSFGTSFADVNVHTDSVQAKSIGALAYTQGSNIHFAPGQYNPQSKSGQSLLGHELTHVVQQRAGRVAVPTQTKGAPINADPSLENEADEMGAKAARGEVAQVPGGGSSGMMTTIPPVQNSTQPVQFFLPMLMGGIGSALGGAASGLMGGLAGGGGPGGMLGGVLGGAASGLAGGLAGGGGPGGMLGGVLGGAASGLAGGLAGGGGPGGMLGGVLGGAASGLAGGLAGGGGPGGLLGGVLGGAASGLAGGLMGGGQK